jgi:hypothetical protein
MHEADAGDEGLDDVDLLQRRDDQQLQVELREEAQAVLGRFVRAAAESFVDDDEAERARAHGAPFEAELVGQAGGEDGVGQLLLLAARLAARIRVVLVLAVVLAPALAGGEDEPVADVGDLGRPAAVLLGESLAAAQTLDDVLDLQELGFRILGVVRAGQLPSVQARSSLWKSRMSASGVACASRAM